MDKLHTDLMNGLGKLKINFIVYSEEMSQRMLLGCCGHKSTRKRHNLNGMRFIACCRWDLMNGNGVSKSGWP